MILIKNERITTKFEPINNEDVINKGYVDEKFLKRDGHLSFLEKDYNEFNLHFTKQSLEEVLVQRAVKTTIQNLFDKSLFDNYVNAEKVLENILFTTRHRGDIKELNNDIQRF